MSEWDNKRLKEILPWTHIIVELQSQNEKERLLIEALNIFLINVDVISLPPIEIDKDGLCEELDACIDEINRKTGIEMMSEDIYKFVKKVSFVARC